MIKRVAGCGSNWEKIHDCTHDFGWGWCCFRRSVARQWSKVVEGGKEVSVVCGSGGEWWLLLMEGDDGLVAQERARILGEMKPFAMFSYFARFGFNMPFLMF